MRKFILIALVLSMCVPLLARKKKDVGKDWPSAKVLDVKTQDLTSASYSPTDNRATSMSGQQMTPISNGGAFTSAPTHFIRYNVVLDAGDELLYITRDREVTFDQPELKIGSEIKWKSQGPKAVDIIDGKGKRMEFQWVKRVKKDSAAVQEKK